MNYKLAKRLLICLAIGFFIICSITTISCSRSRIKVQYEKDDNSGYCEAGYKRKKV